MQFSVIIPTWRDDQTLANCLNSLLKQNYPPSNFEIILASKKNLDIKNKKVHFVRTGPKTNHAQARNLAVKQSKGDILAFCDDDCILPNNWLSTAYFYFEKNKGDLIGGPVVAPKNTPFSFRLSAYLASSRFAMGFAAYKFASYKERKARDSDLILANTFIRKHIFEEVKGFDKEQVPCEENLLYEKVRKSGYKLLYVPKLACSHPSKPIFIPLARKIYFYAQGRGLLIGRAPYTFRFQYLIPSLFVIALISLAVISFFSTPLFLLLLSIISIYTLLNLLNSFLVFLRLEKNPAIFFVAPVATFMMHVAYGLGFLDGYFRYLFKKRNAIKMPSKY